MAKPRNSFEELAREGAARLDAARAQGQQLSLLPDEAGVTPQDVAGGQVGRPKGAKNKVSTQMRDWLAAQGYKMPEDVLAQMAGLASRDDAIMTAMAAAERVLTWAYAGAKDKNGNAVVPSGEQRIATFLQLYTIQLRAADALLPYGAPKATPDVNVQQTVTVNVPGAPEQPGDRAQVIEGRAPRTSGRMVPADVAWENEQNQQLSEDAPENSDGKIRT